MDEAFFDVIVTFFGIDGVGPCRGLWSETEEGSVCLLSFLAPMVRRPPAGVFLVPAR